MENRFGVLLGAELIKVDGTDLYFDNGKVLSVHEYETYIEDYNLDKNENKIYEIEVSYLTDYGFIIRANSYISPMGKLPKIEDDLRSLNYKGKVLFDLILSNGFTTNTFVEGEFDGSKFIKDSFEKVKITYQPFLNEIFIRYAGNMDLLNNSSLLITQKDILNRGLLLKE